MERMMRIALLSLTGAAAFKVAYATLYIEDAREREVMLRQEAEASVFEEREELRRD